MSEVHNMVKIGERFLLIPIDQSLVVLVTSDKDTAQLYEGLKSDLGNDRACIVIFHPKLDEVTWTPLAESAELKALVARTIGEIMAENTK